MTIAEWGFGFYWRIEYNNYNTVQVCDVRNLHWFYVKIFFHLPRFIITTIVISMLTTTQKANMPMMENPSVILCEFV